MSTAENRGEVAEGRPLSVFLCAGEASADALGASLIAALRRRVPELRAFGMGGPRMEAEGLELWVHAREVGVVGLVEILRQLPRLFRLMWALARRAAAERPDVAVLIDLPDFNVRLARRLTRSGVPVVMYVGPSVWAWRQGRVRTFRRWVRRMLVLFPFEVPIWDAAGVDVVAVGHPMVDEVPEAEISRPVRSQAPRIDASTSPLAQASTPTHASNSRPTERPDDDRPSSPASPPTPDGEKGERVIALLPGSRRSELDRHLPVMLDSATILRGLGLAERFVLVVAPTVDRRAIEDALCGRSIAPYVELCEGDAVERRSFIATVDLAVVASGTATLEVALLGRPQIIVYRLHGLSWAIGRALMKVRYFGLPNLLANDSVVPELLQGQFTVEAVVRLATQMLSDPSAEARSLALASRLRGVLGARGAADRAAAAVLDLISPRLGGLLAPGVAGAPLAGDPGVGSGADLGLRASGSDDAVSTIGLPGEGSAPPKKP